VPNPPKLDPQRGARGRGVRMLPAGGRQGDPPAWPASGEPTDDELATWTQLWGTPQAAAWEELGAGTIREVARYCRLLVKADSPNANAAVHAQATSLADRLGLSPKAMRLLLWQISTDDLADKRQETSQGARGRIRAVG
jgi:hypothetical protein